MNSFPLKAAFVCGLLITPVLLAQNFSIPPVKTCTVTSIGGVPIAGMWRIVAWTRLHCRRALQL